MSDDSSQRSAGSARIGIRELRDLSDFCQHWSDLRAIAIEPGLLGESPTDEQREMMNWLIALADAVCAAEEI